MERGAGAGAGAGAGCSSSEDEGGYGAGKELDARISSYPPLWWLVLAHLLIVGFPEGGKTSWLLTFLMWATNEFALRQYYSEVIIIPTPGQINSHFAFSYQFPHQMR